MNFCPRSAAGHALWHLIFYSQVTFRTGGVEGKKNWCVCNIQWNNGEGVQTWKWIGKKSNIQRSQSHAGILKEEKKKHTLSQLVKGIGPILVTQPRHNLQVSFQNQHVNWSALKVIQTRVRGWGGCNSMASCVEEHRSALKRLQAVH